MFDRLSEWLTEEHLWKYVSIACFSNDEDCPFRELLSWWQGFQGDSDKPILDAYESAPHMFVHNTYGLPESYWQYLVDSGVNALILSGVETDATISKVAMDAFDRGIRVFVVPDFLASTYGEAGHTAGLLILRKVLGRDHILSVDEARNMLRALEVSEN